MARPAVLTGRTLSDLLRNTFILGLQLGVGVALGFRWHNGLGGMLAAIGVALAFGYACSWLMAYLGLTIPNSEAIQAAIYMVVFRITLTSSVFLPTQTMPGWLQAFADHQPITITANALRGLTLGQSALPAGYTVTGETLLALTWTVGPVGHGRRLLPIPVLESASSPVTEVVYVLSTVHSSGRVADRSTAGRGGAS